MIWVCIVIIFNETRCIVGDINFMLTEKKLIHLLKVQLFRQRNVHAVLKIKNQKNDYYSFYSPIQESKFSTILMVKPCLIETLFTFKD